MAAYDLEEQETIDELKAWWKQHGKLVLLAAAAFVISASGMQGWRYYAQRQAEQAAEAYAALVKAVAGRDVKKIQDAATVILDRHAGTPYGPRAALIAARSSLEAGDVASAKLRLTWVLDHAHDPELQDATRLRLAGVLLDEKKYDEALKLVEVKHGEFFNALYLDLKGDIFAIQGKAAEARGAYQSALQQMDRNSPYRALVQAKLDSLGEAK